MTRRYLRAQPQQAKHPSRHSRTNALPARCSALVNWSPVMRYALLLCLILPFIALVPIGAETLREVHIQTDPEDGEAMVLLRFPLRAAMLDGFVTQRNGTAYLDQRAYEQDYDGFVRAVLRDLQFKTNTQTVQPIFGAMSLVALPEEAPLPGVMSAQMMLDICTDDPGQFPLDQLEVVVHLYLPGVTAQTPLRLDLPQADIPLRNQITDHRTLPAQIL